MSKVFEALSTLSNKELQSFSNFLESPFFCQHEETRALMSFASQFHPDYPEDLLDQYNECQQPKKLKRPRFNVLKTYIFNHLQEFFVQQKLKADSTAHALLLTEALRERELYRESSRKREELNQFLLENQQMDSSLLISKVKMSELGLDLYLLQGQRDEKLPLEELFNALDQLQLGYGMKYLLPAWTLKNMFSHPFPEERWNASKLQARTAASPLTRIFYHLLCLLRGENPVVPHYDEIKSILRHYESRISQEELLNIYGYLQNYFTHRFQNGDPNALEGLFEVLLKLYHHGFTTAGGDLSGHIVRNITITGCRLNKTDWVGHFLEDNQGQIEAKLGGNAYAYSRAYLDFSRKDYSGALRRLQELQFVDPFYRTGHQVLLLRIYYEISDFESLDALAGTFRRYLNRTDAISEGKKDLSRNFISVLHQLAKAKEYGPSDKLLRKIFRMLEDIGQVTDRTWLWEKYEELSAKVAAK